MRRKLLFIGVIFLLLLSVAITPFSVRAEGDPPPNPEPVKPPWITGVNPEVNISSDQLTEISASGLIESWQGMEAPLLAAPPSYVDLEPQLVEDLAPEVNPLAVPQFYQDPSDATCGAAALGMALEFLSLNGEGNSPSQATLVSDLKNTGLLYETGTGVEELAFLARQHGYQGTTAFHDWTLVQLSEQLETGKPVVVSLGANGANQPGHFVTLTGVSDDGKWISYNDPVLGKQTIGTDTFQELWDLQGNSGLVARKQPLSVADDPMLPWMGLLGAVSTLSVLVKYYPQSGKYNSLLSVLQRVLGNPRRKGLGGKLVPVYEWQEVQDGTKVVQDTSKKIYEYGTRMVQDGWKTVTNYSKKIYEYGTRMVQDGWKTVTNYSKKIYEYGTRMVQNGWKTVKNYGKKIYEYGTRWVTKGWKKISSWVRGIRGWFKKTKWVPKKVKEKFVKGWHYATKTVPKMVKETYVKGWHYATKTVPNMVKETFVKGWKYATKTVPNMVKETFIKGWHYDTKKVPKYVMKKVQVGWKEEQPAVPIDDDTEVEKPEVIPPGYTLEQWNALPYSLQKILLDAYYAQLQENEKAAAESGDESKTTGEANQNLPTTIEEVAIQLGLDPTYFVNMDEAVVLGFFNGLQESGRLDIDRMWSAPVPERPIGVPEHIWGGYITEEQRWEISGTSWNNPTMMSPLGIAQLFMDEGGPFWPGSDRHGLHMDSNEDDARCTGGLGNMLGGGTCWGNDNDEVNANIDAWKDKVDLEYLRRGIVEPTQKEKAEVLTYLWLTEPEFLPFFENKVAVEFANAQLDQDTFNGLTNWNYNKGPNTYTENVSGIQPPPPKDNGMSVPIVAYLENGEYETAIKYMLTFDKDDPILQKRWIRNALTILEGIYGAGAGGDGKDPVSDLIDFTQQYRNDENAEFMDWLETHIENLP